MAIVSMTDAVNGGIASSAEYNKLIDNIQDLDARLGAVVSASTAHARLNTLESRTTDTATSPGGIGNQRLADRLDTGVGTGSNVTTGSASAQLGNLRSRMTVVEGLVGGAFNAPYIHVRQTAAQSIVNNGYRKIAWAAAGVVESRGLTLDDANDQLVVSSGSAGLYVVRYTFGLEPNATEGRAALIQVNGSNVEGSNITQWNAGSALNTVLNGSILIRLAVADTIQLYGYSRTSTLNTVVTGEARTSLQACWIAT